MQEKNIGACLQSAYHYAGKRQRLQGISPFDRGMEKI